MRIKTYVEAVASVAPTQSIIAQLEQRRGKLDNYWTDYSNIQSQIELLDETEVNDRINFEERFYALSAKIRVVFDASCKDSAGISLNDALRIGPTIRFDIHSNAFSPAF